MLKRLLLPCTSVVLMICEGCYPNPDVINPWKVSPPSASTSWHPTHLKKTTIAVISPKIPTQEAPLTLAELIDTALTNNTQTQITWAQARQAAASYAQSQSGFFPSLTGVVMEERSRSPTFFSGFNFNNTPGGANAFNVASNTNTGANGSNFSVNTGNNSGKLSTFYLTEWNPDLSLTYTVLDFGQMRATSEAARQALFYADWTHNREIQTVIQNITNDYYNYLYQKQLLDSYFANVENAQTTYHAAEVSFESGTQDIADVLQAKTTLLQNETQWINQKQAVESSFANLLYDMGLPANYCFDIEPLPEVNPSDYRIEELDKLIQLAVQKRPDLLAAEADLKSKEASLKAAQREFFPTLNYQFVIGRTYFNGGLHDDYDFSSLFTFNIPLFSGFNTLNGVKLAKSKKKQSEANLQQVELGVIRDLTVAHSNVKISFETLKYSQEFLKAAAKQFKVALGQYEAGVNTILNVVSAQSSLANARATLASSIQQWFTSLATLAYATGVLSETELPTGKEEFCP